MNRRSSSVTIRDVARQAGVSVATVSRYINHKAPVSSRVAKRLDSVLTELRYVPHAAARRLASTKTRMVGLLLNKLHNDFFIPLLNGIEAVIRQKNYNLIIATCHAKSCKHMNLPIGPHNADGLLVFSDALFDEDLAKLNASGFPMVLVHRTPPGSLAIPSVTVENVAITHKLVDHLIQVHGRRRILFLRGPIQQEDSIKREMGYKSALQANGIPFDENLVLHGDFERDIAYQVMDHFLDNGRQVAFDAVFAGDDDAAMGVLRALHQRGWRVPEDVSVIGFDDQGFAPFLNPPLTTVRAPTERVGQIATERLFGLLEDHPTNEVLVLPTEIIFRRSCGCESWA
ncbi:MAG TPA: LacI family DNA-binding transcriptional regulator [Anaerolineales bacterium]|nr:LacI family DNA-binding transcriptional regulator [Anaerolineales bacterium]